MERCCQLIYLIFLVSGKVRSLEKLVGTTSLKVPRIFSLIQNYYRFTDSGSLSISSEEGGLCLVSAVSLNRRTFKRQVIVSLFGWLMPERPILNPISNFMVGHCYANSSIFLHIKQSSLRSWIGLKTTLPTFCPSCRLPWRYNAYGTVGTYYCFFYIKKSSIYKNQDLY